MAEYLLDDHWIFDAGDDPDRAFALLALTDVNAEHPLEPSCPRHGSALFHWVTVIGSSGSVWECVVFLAPLPRFAGVMVIL